MTLGFLTTRVGRRFLAVNMLTALAPVAVIAAISFATVRAELRDQAEERVGRLSKSLGIGTLSYLTAASFKLQSALVDSAPAAPFDSVIRLDATLGAPASLGVLSRPLTTEEVRQLGDGRSLLLLTASPTTHDEARIVMGRALLPWAGASRAIVWGRVRRDALFGESDEAIEGEDALFCVFAMPTLARITCSTQLDRTALDVAQHRARGGGSDADTLTTPGFFVSARDIYLRHEYGSAEWRTVVLQPQSVSFAAAATFRNTFLLLIAAVVVLIFAVSHAQIRRTTEPLAQLKDGTRRLQSGDFGTPVIVEGDDEYSEVARSFNGMASTLHRQITLMHNLDAVDQSALGTHNSSAVVDETLACIAASLDCITVTVAIVRPDDPTALDATSRHTISGERRTTTKQLSDTDRTELLAHPRQLSLEAGAAQRSYMPRVDVTYSLSPSLVLPLVHDGALLGVIAIRLRVQPANEIALAEARRIADRVALALSNVQLLTRLDALSAGTVLAFARAIDANSPWTAGHSERVTHIAIEIARELGLSAQQLDTLERGGLLHDIGKIAVPPAVLDKAGKLTDDEWAVMRRHPIVGCEILSPIPAFADALPIVRSHHERMDGTGYPDQLYGDQIPYLARVLAVADVFDALASDRPYRAGMTTAEACAIIQMGSGAHFDPRIVRAFLDAVHAGRIEAIADASDSRQLAASVAKARGETRATVPQLA